MTAAVVSIAAVLVLAAIVLLLWRVAKAPAVPAAAREALRFVWTQTWGLPAALVPLLVAAKPGGADGRQFWAGTLGRWVYGVTSEFGEGCACTVCFPPGVPLHETALVHEAAHAASKVDHGYLPDDAIDHADPVFLKREADGKAALAARGT